jgi:KaiC/GvpD/RAD55 family RecA-like ATPase
LEENLLNQRQKKPKTPQFGNKVLDGLVPDQIPKGFSCLIQGFLGSRGDVLFKQLVKHQVETGSLVDLVLTEPTSRILFEDLIPLQGETFSILDASNTNIPKATYSSKLSFYDLRLKVGQMLDRVQKPKTDHYLFYWTMNPLLINFPTKEVTQYFFKMVQDCAQKGRKEFFYIQSDITSEQVMSALTSVAHGVIKLEPQILQNDLTVTKLRILKMLGVSYNTTSTVLE